MISRKVTIFLMAGMFSYISSCTTSNALKEQNNEMITNSSEGTCSELFSNSEPKNANKNINKYQAVLNLISLY
jgi:hypothetical protein